MSSLIFIIVFFYIVASVVSSAKNDEKRKKEEVEEKRKNYQRAIDMHRYERGELDWQKQKQQETLSTQSYNINDNNTNVDESDLFDNNSSNQNIEPTPLSEYPIPQLDILQEIPPKNYFQTSSMQPTIDELNSSANKPNEDKNGGSESSTLKDDFFSEYGIEDLKIGI